MRRWNKRESAALSWSAMIVLVAALMSLCLIAEGAYSQEPSSEKSSAENDSLMVVTKAEYSLLVNDIIWLESDLEMCQEALALKEDPPECEPEGFPWVPCVIAALAGGLSVALLR